MEEIFKILKQLKDLGLVSDYAIGGGVATIMHTRPFTTEDLDVFATIPRNSVLVDLTPIWNYLQGLGYAMDGQYIIVGGIPIQFIDPAPGSIEEEALKNSQTEVVYGVSVPVFRPEYLIAIYLRLGRPGDRGKLEYLRAYSNLDHGLLKTVIQKHGLQKQWQEFHTKNT